MPNLTLFIASVSFYILSARLVLSSSLGRLRAPLFALVNILAVAAFTLQTQFDKWQPDMILNLGIHDISRHLLLVAGYVLAISGGFFLTRRFADGAGMLPWVAFFYPISLLIVFRYMTFLWAPIVGRLTWPGWTVSAAIVGLSYMAFRLSYLVIEVRNGIVRMPSLSEYLGFAFFLPTILIGPISPFSSHQASVNSATCAAIPFKPAILRIVVGAAKFFFVANILNQLTYTGIFVDERPHALIDLFAASVFYYLYLFCNFSGFCDMAIGMAALVGITVTENFDNPFLARNVKEFWNRWHITLSEYVRNLVFAPMSTGLIRRFGVKYSNLSIAAAIVAVFLVIGIWHGLELHYILFGLAHAAAMIVNHYYTIWMKTWLGAKRYKLYNENPYVNAAAVALTFVYISLSFALFANSSEMLALLGRSVQSE